MKLWIPWLLLMFVLDAIHCWDNEELEIFDLVEEVNTNFYTLLGVPENADASEIRRAYRRLSLVLHPDKNDASDAEVKFRQLVAVYDVLRDANRRMRYNDVLKNGLPDWRQAVYYYRRVRKMGLSEMSVILFVLVTVGQYIVSWAAYLEKKYTAEQFLNMRLKKLHKKQKKGKYDGPALPETIVLDIPTPSVRNTLPFQLPCWLFWFVVVFCPRSVTLIREYWMERKQRKQQEQEDQWSEEEEEAELEVRGPRHRKGRAFQVPELGVGNPGPPGRTEGCLLDPGESPFQSDDNENKTSTQLSGGLWTDDDLAELVRLVKKFPPGTASRWEKVANFMGRSVAEVTHMAKKVKEDGYRIATSGGSVTPAEQEASKSEKVKTRATVLSPEAEWGQVQQKALEAALTKYPKGGSSDRWDKIAKCVPGKSKEECMLRYKQLVEMVKKRKVNGEVTSQQQSHGDDEKHCDT
ncbi:dnaJ homolog subfamily C member 1 [Zootermopsis nevadensis]|uniref:DnaJ-like protein subfamily C member 1 n=1 Tax=Zootermopsis nevadensis TaxID=136037 RepID=A0A067RH82_ZOONE|nr:dnaJ homolog subfamily C member 1 [Zootermopsis nevadensis]XP_021940148.1 dnaJ homolog subfamily C member 1 [Zootermopsis nevadensis]XP_021940156.1 dnaJ homolog subfamily C member 1 [Zootermopsis nevadensis]XP_021940163.1 dnaJ homolog subfamily C member 1 [Zootermopsis nevadensis]KDR23191.1 DnaJ-like protein subfamily C member 1 [Zootermopsis nevadensis]